MFRFVKISCDFLHWNEILFEFLMNEYNIAGITKNIVGTKKKY